MYHVEGIGGVEIGDGRDLGDARFFGESGDFRERDNDDEKYY